MRIGLMLLLMPVFAADEHAQVTVPDLLIVPTVEDLEDKAKKAAQEEERQLLTPESTPAPTTTSPSDIDRTPTTPDKT